MMFMIMMMKLIPIKLIKRFQKSQKMCYKILIYKYYIHIEISKLFRPHPVTFHNCKSSYNHLNMHIPGSCQSMLKYTGEVLGLAMKVLHDYHYSWRIQSPGC